MLKLLALDRFTILLVLMVLLATLLPISGQLAYYFNILTTVAIAVLFFLHGAKLSREAVIEGMLHWRMHALVFILLFDFPIDWTFVETCFRTSIGATVILGLLVYVFLTFHGSVFDCIYVYG